MALNQCPQCNAGVVPGQVACTRCGYDFIKGANPSEWESEDDHRKRTTATAVGVGAAVIVAAIVGYLVVREPPPPPIEPCIPALGDLRGAVQAGSADAAIPSCPDTPPGSVSCWAPMGLTLSKMPSAPGERYRLTPTAGGFDIECRVDADKDGKEALYRTTQDVGPVRITGVEIR